MATFLLPYLNVSSGEKWDRQPFFSFFFFNDVVQTHIKLLAINLIWFTTPIPALSGHLTYILNVGSISKYTSGATRS